MSEPASISPWVVLKFGGTSVSSLERWQTIAATLRQRLDEGYRPLVVCSALAGGSNLLEEMLAKAESGEEFGPLLDRMITAHRDLGADMELDVDEVIGDLFQELDRLVRGARLLEETSPRVRARVMSMGELMSTRMGAAWLNRHGLRTAWQDARELLQAEDARDISPERHYLSATCNFDRDPQLERDLHKVDADVLLTQGFIAADSGGDTVLLGRGGSDTSAAYMAARVGAQRLEIWTDVPGMFTANPRQVPTARLLRHINYEEAQELALMGAKVLHPRCIGPVHKQGIPLHIKCTTAPDMQGTVISSEAPTGIPQVKAVSARKGILLLSLHIDRGIHNVGFLSEATEYFKRHGLSIDMVAASETNVTFSLDPGVNLLSDEVVDALIEDLNHLCRTTVLGPGAAVSLVGSNIRAILHELGPTLERFEDQKVYMVSQAADDLNLTFIVAEDEADRLITDLHTLLFPPDRTDPSFGPSWDLLFEKEPTPMAIQGWWTENRDALLSEAAQGTPAFVYHAPRLQEAIDELDALPLDRLFYSVKANPNPEVLRYLHQAGLGLQCGSRGELDLVERLFGKLGERLMFAPHAARKQDFEKAIELGAHITLGVVYPLESWPELFRGHDLFLRVDAGHGQPEQPYVRTAGPQSKFGIAPAALDHARRAADDAGARIIGLHAHAGSGLRTTDTWRDIGFMLARLARSFPDVRILNLGGGLGVPERRTHSDVDLGAVAEGLNGLKKTHARYQLWMEPGRFLVARAGVLLGQVLDVTTKGSQTFITVDAGINSLIRPALYGAWHETLNLTRWGQRVQVVADVVGPLCESVDVLAHERQLPETHPGDIIAIANAGAYGHAMASSFNSTEPAREVVHGTRHATSRR